MLHKMVNFLPTGGLLAYLERHLYRVVQRMKQIIDIYPCRVYEYVEIYLIYL